MNNFICIFSLVLALTIVTVQSTENLTAPVYATYFQDIIPDDRIVKSVPQPELPHGRTGTGRIFRGKDVSLDKQNEYKYQCKLVTKKPRGVFGCGGTIIGTRLVLTAAHCLYNGLYTTVYFGLLNQYDRKSAQQQRLHPSDWIMHPKYDDTEIRNDVALLLLPLPIQFNDIIGKVILPPANHLCPHFAGSSVIISGWGALDDANSAPKILQYANVKVAPPEQCQSIYTTAFLRESMICADATNAGTCQGDSGGPMIWNNNGHPTVIGVVSFGAENCEHSTHRVFTCVARFVKWIIMHGQNHFL